MSIGLAVSLLPNLLVRVLFVLVPQGILLTWCFIGNLLARLNLLHGKITANPYSVDRRSFFLLLNSLQ